MLRLSELEQRACKWCYTLFTPVNGKNLYCSFTCSVAYKTGDPQPDPPKPEVEVFATCKQCKKQFKKEAPKQIFCGDKCYLQQNKEVYATPVRHWKRECHSCGKLFIPRAKQLNVNFCCRKCVNLRYAKVVRRNQSEDEGSSQSVRQEDNV